MADVSSATKFFPTAKEGFTTTTSGTVAPGATSVSLSSVSGLTNGDVMVFVIDPTDATKKQVFTGTVDTGGSQITNVIWTEGTNTTHSTGATVVDYETATHWALYSTGLQVAHEQTGALKSGVVGTDNLVSSAVTAAKLGTDSVTTAKIADSNVTTAKIAASAVTSPKLSPSIYFAETGATGQSITTSYTDVTNGSITFTATETCKILVWAHLHCRWSGTPSVSSFFRVLSNGTGSFATAYEIRNDAGASGVLFDPCISQIYDVSTTGSITVKMQAKTNQGTLEVFGGQMLIQVIKTNGA